MLMLSIFRKPQSRVIYQPKARKAVKAQIIINFCRHWDVLVKHKNVIATNGERNIRVDNTSLSIRVSPYFRINELHI